MKILWRNTDGRLYRVSWTRFDLLRIKENEVETLLELHVFGIVLSTKNNTWTKFTTLVGHGKLFGNVAFQYRTLCLLVDFVALDDPVEADARQTRFKIDGVAVFEHDVAFGPARFCKTVLAWIFFSFFVFRD